MHILTCLFLLQTVARPRLNNTLLDRVCRARSFPNRNFHSLMILHHLARWGLGPKPYVEALSYETTTHQSKFPFRCIILFFF